MKSNVNKKAGAAIVLEAIINEGINTIFGYPGGAIMPIYDALFDYKDSLNHILVRHEQGGIHAAQGFARVSGKTGVVFATSGPGATNLVTGLADAMIDSTPIVCITGQVYSHLLGTDAFQETDVINITLPVTKWNYQVTDAEELHDVLAKAFFIARTGRPGPVVIDITKNAQLQHINFEKYIPCSYLANYNIKPTINTESIKSAATAINNAERPFVIFGQGVLLGSANNELIAFIEKAGIPAAWTILGMSAIPTDHYLAAGMLGMHGNYAPNILTNQCDVLIAIGMRFDDRVTGRLDNYAKQAKIIHFDIDDSEINKNVIADITVLGDCKETLRLINKVIQKKSYPEWYKQFTKYKDEEIKIVIQDELYPREDEITMGEVIRALNEITNGGAIIVTDVGQHQMITCRYAELKKPFSNITSGGLGTMGFALPAAIGCSYGDPSRSTVAVIGDGGFQMTIQELGTIMQCNANVKILILNNQSLGMVRQWQQLFHNERYSFVDIQSPDFVHVAKGYGIQGKSVSNREMLKEALKEMLNHPGSYLLEVMVCKKGNVFPMIPQGKSISEIVLTENEIS